MVAFAAFAVAAASDPQSELITFRNSFSQDKNKRVKRAKNNTQKAISTQKEGRNTKKIIKSTEHKKKEEVTVMKFRNK